MFVNASNNAVAKLSSNINSSQTSLTVDDASIFPDAPFLITVNEEIMRVTNVSSNTLTVQRGREGTSASSHNVGSNVENNFTAGTYQALVEEIKALKQQSGIAEMGENENGNYIRYENGIQMCWHYIKANRQVALRIGFTWVFPRAFIHKPIINFNLSAEDYYLSISLRELAEGYVREADADSVQISWVRDVESPTAFGEEDYAHAYVKAIGRWK